MNEAEFKRHLKDLVRGHHHPEQHDWDRPQTEKTKSSAKRAAPRKSPKKK